MAPAGFGYRFGIPIPGSEEVAEVVALGGSGFRFVINLEDRTCSCRQWKVCGVPCKHALAFITSLSDAHINCKKGNPNDIAAMLAIR